MTTNHCGAISSAILAASAPHPVLAAAMWVLSAVFLSMATFEARPGGDQ